MRAINITIAARNAMRRLRLVRRGKRTFDGRVETFDISKPFRIILELDAFSSAGTSVPINRGSHLLAYHVNDPGQSKVFTSFRIFSEFLPRILPAHSNVRSAETIDTISRAGRSGRILGRNGAIVDHLAWQQNNADALRKSFSNHDLRK